MKKKNSRIGWWSVFILMLALLFITGTVHVRAEMKQGNLFNNDTVKDMSIWISYETDDVTILLIDPDGNTIDPTDEESGCNVFIGETGMLILIPDAMPGQWQLSYDKGSNGALEVQVNEYEDQLWITEFTLDGISKDELQVTFNTAYEGDLSYQYVLSLTTDTAGGAGKELAAGSAPANEEQQVRADLSAVNTYDAYYLMLSVSYTKDGVDYFDYAYTEEFSYTNAETVDALEDVSVLVDLYTGTVTWDWSDYIDGDVDGVYIILEADGEELDETYVNRSEETQASVTADEGTEEMTARITVRYTSGLISGEFEKTISLVPDEDTGEFYVKFPESGSVNATTVTYEYYNADAQAFSVGVNYEYETVELDGTGTNSLPLEDGSNLIAWSYTEKEADITWSDTIFLTVDRVAPSLTLLENYDGSVTENSSLVIVGQTDADATLEIAGETVEVSESGTFSQEIALVQGENQITISARDDAGNTTSRTILVSRGTGSAASGTAVPGILPEKIRTWLPLILTLCASAALVILLVLVYFVVKGRKQRGFFRSLRMFTVYFAVLSLPAAVTGWILWIVRHSYIRSRDYIDYAGYYAAEAYTYLKNTNRYLWMALICTVLFAVMLLLSLVANRYKKRSPEQMAEFQEKQQRKKQRREERKQRRKESRQEKKKNEQRNGQKNEQKNSQRNEQGDGQKNSQKNEQGDGQKNSQKNEQENEQEKKKPSTAEKIS